MNTSTTRTILLAAALAGALGGCGGGERADAAGRPAGDEAPQVYTSEVESVSEWIRESGAGDSVELVAAKNPKGEGVVVYARGKDGAADTQTAAWMVVDSQVVPLNRASRRITPKLPARSDQRTWSRIGITRPAEEEDADLRDVIPPARAPQRAQAREAARPPAPPAEERRDSAAPASRTSDVRDTLRIPAGPAPRDTAAAPPATSRPKPAREPRDTLVVPSTPRSDTSRGPGTEPAAPAAPTARPPQIEAEATPPPASQPPVQRE